MGERLDPLTIHMNPIFLTFSLNAIISASLGWLVGSLYLPSYRVALQPAVLSAALVWPSVSRYLEISFGLREPSPQGFTSFGGGLLTGP